MTNSSSSPPAASPPGQETRGGDGRSGGLRADGRHTAVAERAAGEVEHRAPRLPEDCSTGANPSRTSDSMIASRVPRTCAGRSLRVARRSRMPFSAEVPDCAEQVEQHRHELAERLVGRADEPIAQARPPAGARRLPLDDTRLRRRALTGCAARRSRGGLSTATSSLIDRPPLAAASACRRRARRCAWRSREPSPCQPRTERREQHALRAFERDVGDMQRGPRNLIAGDHALHARVEPRAEDEDLNESSAAMAQKSASGQSRARWATRTASRPARTNSAALSARKTSRPIPSPSARRDPRRPELQRRLDRRDPEPPGRATGTAGPAP